MGTFLALVPFSFLSCCGFWRVQRRHNSILREPFLPAGKCILSLTDLALPFCPTPGLGFLSRNPLVPCQQPRGEHRRHLRNREGERAGSLVPQGLGLGLLHVLLPQSCLWLLPPQSSELSLPVRLSHPSPLPCHLHSLQQVAPTTLGSEEATLWDPLFTSGIALPHACLPARSLESLWKEGHGNCSGPKLAVLSQNSNVLPGSPEARGGKTIPGSQGQVEECVGPGGIALLQELS